MTPLALVLVSLAVALLAQFALERWADQSDVVHWIQHGLLFWAGIGVGVGLSLAGSKGPVLAKFLGERRFADRMGRRTPVSMAEPTLPSLR